MHHRKVLTIEPAAKVLDVLYGGKDRGWQQSYDQSTMLEPHPAALLGLPN